MKENKKTIQLLAVVTLLIAVVCISVGFALMSTQLTIGGTAKIIPAKWDVHYVTDDGASPTPNAVTPTFSNNSTTACEAQASGCLPDGETAPPAYTYTSQVFSGYQIVLKKPGDKGTYTFDIENAGDINAKISNLPNANLATADTGLTITSSGTGDEKTADEAAVTGHISYKILWDSDGSAIQLNDTLNAGQTRRVRIEVEYKDDATSLPKNPVTITGRDVIITFQQAN